MLGIISAAGNALRAFGSVHPAIKWGVVVLAGLLAVEVVGKEAVSLWVAIQTAPAEVTKAKLEQGHAEAGFKTLREMDDYAARAHAARQKDMGEQPIDPVINDAATRPAMPDKPKPLSKTLNSLD
jgi:hypothetical protein